jgi:hypothetical protein
MARSSPEFCWHHGNLKRLRQCLDKNYCDLRGGELGIRWYKRHRLYEGMPVRFSVRGKVVAFGRIQGKPYDLATERKIQPMDPKWPGAVDIGDVCWRDGGDCSSPPRWGSHRL